MAARQFYQSVLEFNKQLKVDQYQFPPGIRAMNPFRGENRGLIRDLTTRFYQKYYNDQNTRRVILGINPGRFGAGLTGIPFTDTKRLNEDCGITVDQISSHEPSSVFVYEVIQAYGGPEKFYGDYFITSLCPVGFVLEKTSGKEVNYNFYDDKKLQKTIEPFIIKSLKKQIDFGLETEKAILMGTGKNYQYFKTLNRQHRFFNEVIPVEHPRYVMQYKHKSKDQYINKYLKLLV